MLGGIYDPFFSISGDDPNNSVISAGIHIGVVKSYISSTKTCMVVVPSVSGKEAVGPMQLMRSFSSSSFNAPSIGDKVVVAFIDGTFNNGVVLGKIVY